MKIKTNIIFLFSFLIAGALAFTKNAVSQQIPNISIEAEANKVGLGEVVSISIEVSTEGSKPQNITLPSFEGFDVVSRSVSSPIQFSFGLGQGVKMTYTTRYDIDLMGKTVGVHKIGPVIVKFAGKEYESGSIVIEVTREKQGVGSKGGGYPSNPFDIDPFKDFDDIFKKPFDRFKIPDIQPGPTTPPEPSEETPPPPQGLDGAKYDPDVFLRTIVTPKKVYVGQQATLDFYLYTRLNVSNIDVTREPSGSKFWTRDLLSPTGRVDFTPVDIGGVIFNVATLRKIALFPTESGELEISPGEVNVTTGIGGFFGSSKTYKRNGIPLKIEVLPLPAAGKPPEFDSANVGKYVIEGKVSSTKAIVDQPFSVQFVISGTGNIEMVKAPQVKFPPDVKTYEPQISDTLDIRRFVVGGSKKIEYIVIPSKPGKLTIDPVKFAYFDPQDGRYFVSETKPLEIQVEPSQSGTAGDLVIGNDRDTENVKEEGETIEGLRPIVTIASLSPHQNQYIRSKWFLVLVAIPPVVFFMYIFIGIIRRFIVESKNKNPSSRALAEFRKIIRESSGIRDDTEFYARLQRGILKYLEMKFQIGASGMTTPELRNFLREAGVEEKEADELIGELENCEFARYGRSLEGTKDMRKSLERVRVIVENIDKKTGSRKNNKSKNSQFKNAGRVSIIVVILMSFPFLATGANIKEIFNTANDFYFKGNYEEAIKKYYEILNLGIEDPALYYNTGNAFAMTGEYGKAIFFYEKALKLKPRDSATLKNISIVRNILGRKLTGKGKNVDTRPKETIWESAAGWFSPNEIVVLFLFLYYLFFILLLVRKLTKAQIVRIGISIFVFFTAIGWLLAGSLVIMKYRYDFIRHEGIIVERGVVATREGPTEQSVRSYDVVEGQRVKVEEFRGAWCRIEDERGKSGWLERSSVGML